MTSRASLDSLCAHARETDIESVLLSWANNFERRLEEAADAS